MGMFDWVPLYKAKCPYCGAVVDKFQSKNGSCTLADITPEEARYFYSGCGKCGAWCNAELKPPSRPIYIQEWHNGYEPGGNWVKKDEKTLTHYEGEEPKDEYEDY